MKNSDCNTTRSLKSTGFFFHVRFCGHIEGQGGKMKEEWKVIPAFGGKYEASCFGDIRNAETKHIRKLREDKYGYYRLNISRGDGTGKSDTVPVHQLVALAFIPNPENKPQINHKDGNKKNNCVDNLEWCTASENTKHAHRTGLAYVYHGQDNCRAKFNNEQVLTIRKMYASGKMSQQKIADIYGVAQTTIGRIVRGERYADVEVV